MLTSGDKLSPYEITREFGAGGMGEVYRARDTRLDRDGPRAWYQNAGGSNGDGQRRLT